MNKLNTNINNADSFPKRRGRPSTGTAPTAAKRKALQRERDKQRPMEEQSLEALLSSAGQAILAGDTEALNGISKEMQRRAKAFALDVTVT